MHRTTAALAVTTVVAIATIVVSGENPLNPHNAVGSARHAALVAAPSAVVPDTTPLTGTPTLTTTITATPSFSATVTATAPVATPTRTPLTTPLPSPTATPNTHPGFGGIPWANGEYSVWSIAGRAVHGTAWQLLAHSGHEWIDLSATREIAYGTPSTFTSRLAFDANTYLLRRYDGVEDAPASALRATLFGPNLAYTLYASWRHAGCVVARRAVPPKTLIVGLMPDLLRAAPLLAPRAAPSLLKQPGRYLLFDPYGKRLLTTATYTVLRHETLSTILGRVSTLHVRFREGSQPALDLWYTTTPGHIVVKWGLPGIFGATLSHYEPSSARLTLPVTPLRLKLPAREAACQ